MPPEKQAAAYSPCPDCKTIQPLAFLGNSFLTGQPEYGYACACGFHSIAMIVPKAER